MSKSNKRKKGPWNPSKQPVPAKVAQDLGLPSQRLKHSKAGFESEPTGIGHHRLKEKSPLTHPAIIAQRQAEMTSAHAESGKEFPSEGIRVSLTPSDRVTALNRRILWQYILTRIEIEVGKRRGINYEGSSRSSDLHQLPLTDNQFNRRAFVEWLRKQPGWGYFTNYLDRFVELVDSNAAADPSKIMSKAEIGMWLGDVDSSRDAKNIADGGLGVICHGLAEAAADFAASERQEAIRKKSLRK